MDYDDWSAAHGLAEPSEYKQTKDKTVKTQKRYLWIRPNSAESPMLIINDPVELWRGSQFNEETDQLFEIGPEVKLEVSIKTVPAKPVYRENASGYRTPFENRD
jgi:hypothetical protein